MYEFRNDKYYHPTYITKMINGVRTHESFPTDMLVGQFSTDRCPQCGARHYINRNGDEWCWNCRWDNTLPYEE